MTFDPNLKACVEWLNNSPGRLAKVSDGIKQGVPLWVLSVPTQYQANVRDAVAIAEWRK